uniref:Uncharacterized protein n=1 Tax=Rhizophora mucronata TaxID=61149 RepID=A0A2P2PRF3_RHIMU
MAGTVFSRNYSCPASFLSFFWVSWVLCPHMS